MQSGITTPPADQLNRQRELELTLIYQTAQQITQLQSLSELLPHLVTEVSRTFNYNSMGVLLVDKATNEIVVRETIGLEREKHLGFRLPITAGVEGGIVGWVAYNGQPYLAADVRTSPRYVKTVEATRSELAVPLKIKDEVIGVLDVQSVLVNGLTEEDEFILSTLASQIAIAVENARLYEELAQAHAEIQRKADQLQRLLARTVDLQEEERRRIAADIHDSVIQLIYGALYETEGTLQRLPPNAAATQVDLQNIQTSLKQAISEIYKAIYDLWPASLDEMGLFPSLRSYMVQYEEDTGISCRLRIQGNPIRFNPPARITLFRILQEALYNVRKHAQATEVEVIFTFQEGRVKVMVQDNGIGFDQEKAMAERQHLGLISMRERAENIGGTFTIESKPGRGSVVAWEFLQDRLEREERND
ncbi:MAG: GAF domain-containing sensor histidine kinase [Anaerolineales bacterium]|nr:GAF domain-containing sensor histidine kinase [Anaerolineales bacterium]